MIQTASQKEWVETTSKEVILRPNSWIFPKTRIGICMYACIHTYPTLPYSTLPITYITYTTYTTYIASRNAALHYVVLRYIYINACMHACLRTYTYVHTYIHTSVYHSISVYPYTCIPSIIHIHTHPYSSIRIHTHPCSSIHIQKCLYTYIRSFFQLMFLSALLLCCSASLLFPFFFSPSSASLLLCFFTVLSPCCFLLFRFSNLNKPQDAQYKYTLNQPQINPKPTLPNIKQL